MDDEKLEKAINFIRDKAADHAQAKANRIYLMLFRKSKKAILMANARVSGFESAVAQEREAYADDEYIELLKGIQAAVEQEELLRYQIKAAELKIEIWRTKEATRRKEINQYGVSS